MLFLCAEHYKVKIRPCVSTECFCNIQTCPGVHPDWVCQAHHLQHQALKNPKNACKVTLVPALHLSAFSAQAAHYPEDPTPPMAVASEVNGVYKVNPTLSHLQSALFRFAPLCFIQLPL